MKKILIGLTILCASYQSFAQNTTEFFAKADTFFKAYVVNGKVKYNEIKKDPASLNELLDIASKITVSKSKPKTFQSFFINSYNLAVIKGIINKYPVNSPLKIKGFFDKNTFEIGGKVTTLNDLENKILRKNFPKEARFHFALVCAGLGCPPIIAEAYTPANLEAQLQRQDFTHNGSEIDYINTYRTEKIPSGAKVSYYSYDWTLNQVR